MNNLRWIDIRVANDDVSATIDFLMVYKARPKGPVESIWIDPYPPAAGPESEITLLCRGEINGIITDLEQQGVNALAYRVRWHERASR